MKIVAVNSVNTVYNKNRVKNKNINQNNYASVPVDNSIQSFGMSANNKLTVKEKALLLSLAAFVSIGISISNRKIKLIMFKMFKK